MYVDTNVLLRAATRTPADQTAAVENLLREAAAGVVPALHVAASTVSETVFVLRGKVYTFDRSRIVTFLEALLMLPLRIADRAVIQRAMTIYRDHHDDWDDCLLAAYALERGDGSVISFDRGLDRIPGLRRLEPGAVGEAE